MGTSNWTHCQEHEWLNVQALKASVHNQRVLTYMYRFNISKISCMHTYGMT